MARVNQKRVARERRVAELATAQRGVVARWQLEAMGFGESAIRQHLWTGRLTAFHREVFCVGHQRADRWAARWAAVLAYGPGAVLSHRTAAALWGIGSQGRGPLDVTAPRGRQGSQRRAGIRIHRCRLHPADLAHRDGLPVTSVARTLFDLAEAEGFERARDAAAEADRLRLPWTAEMAAVRVRGRGRRGLRPTRRLLAELQPPDPGRTPLEVRLASFCRAHGIPLPEQNVTVLGREVDGLWSAAKLVAELDSWEFHRHRRAFEEDRARDARFLLAGYRVLRITHRRLDREPHALAHELHHLLRPGRAGAPPTFPPPQTSDGRKRRRKS